MESGLRIYIAIATFFPLVGGAEKQTLALCQRLQERGYEPTIITFRHERSWQTHEVIGGVQVIRVAGLLLADRQKLPRLLQRLLYMLAIFHLAWTLWRCRDRYDILQVIQFNSIVLPLAFVCRLTGRPVVISVRSVGPGQVVNNYSLVAGSLDPAAPWLQIDRTVQYGGDLENLIRWGKYATFLTRWLLTHTKSTVIILSSRMKSYLAEHNLQSTNVQLIPNGVDIVRFKPADVDSCTEERDHVVVCVSRLSHEKGIDVLLQAWHLVHKQLSQAKLIIVGTGPLQAQLQQMAQALHISDCVEFAGLQSNIPAQFQRAGLAVLPSHWEGMPNALLEAMACGLPCVATRVSGSEDIIEHGINGLLVEPGDYESMAVALLSLLRDPLRARSYGQAARARIQQYYSLENVTDRYIELYQNIMEERMQRELSGASTL